MLEDWKVDFLGAKKHRLPATSVGFRALWMKLKPRSVELFVMWTSPMMIPALALAAPVTRGAYRSVVGLGLGGFWLGKVTTLWLGSHGKSLFQKAFTGVTSQWALTIHLGTAIFV